jgi:transcriptional regulator with XRE-family HTH domain
MGEPKVPPIGPRLRAERTRRDLSVRALAREVGVSPSLISQIETGRSQPSVSTLYAITEALGLPVEDLFGPGGDGATSGVPERTRPALPAYLSADRARPVGPYVAPADRELLTLDSGVTWERLGQVPHHHVDFLLVTYQPGGASSAGGELMRHSGTEYGYLVSGRLELTLGFDRHVMGPGDAVCFESATPHRYANPGSEPAVGVWFVVEPPAQA